MKKWIVSTLKNGQSKRQDDEKFLSEIFGDDHPLLIKLIQANETLSVQVHPDDEYASKVENSYGKTECWYILDAKPNATLVCGLTKDFSREELTAAIQNNTLDKCLKNVPVEKGDFIFIPAGTVHAIQGGLRILEIQQPSDVTYRLFDWGRPREIHIEKGLDVVKTYAPETEKPFSKNFSCNYFSLSQQDVKLSKEKIDLTPENPSCPGYQKGYVTLFVISGTGKLFSKTENKEIDVKPEDTLLVKADEEIFAGLDANSKELSLMKIF